MSKISKGFVVTELAIAIVILGILSAVIAPIAYKATMNARASSEGDAVSNYLADLTLKAQPPYTMVTTQWAIDAGISLADYTSGSDVINMFGNYITFGYGTLSGGATNGAVSITEDVPNATCLVLVEKVANSADEISVGSTTVKTLNNKLDVSSATTACNVDGNVTLTFLKS